MTRALAPYAPPTVVVETVPDTWSPGNHHGGKPQFTRDGGYRRPDVFVILNVRTGQLTARNGLAAFNRDHDVDGRGWNGAPGWYDPSSDLWVCGYGWGRTPTQLAWVGNSSRWMQDAAGVNAHLERIRPFAQELVDALDPVPGTGGDYDWTLRATGADGAINTLVTYGDSDDQPVIPDRPGRGAITFAELIEADPDLVDPLWVTMTDAQLDEVAREWVGAGGRSGKFLSRETERRLCAYFGWDTWGSMPYLAHARIDLRRWRDSAIAAATGLPTVYASELFDSYDGDDLSASSTNVDVEKIVARIDATVAHRNKVAVVGTREMLLEQRAQMRARVRREAQAAGAAVAQLEEQLRTARATRDGLLSQVIGFGEQPEHNPDGTLNFAEVARLGSMSRVAAGKKFREVDEEIALEES